MYQRKNTDYGGMLAPAIVIFFIYGIINLKMQLVLSKTIHNIYKLILYFMYKMLTCKRKQQQKICQINVVE